MSSPIGQGARRLQHMRRTDLTSDRLCSVIELGLVGYREAWQLQRSIAEGVSEGSQADSLLLLEHPHVYTLGRRGKASDITVSNETLVELGAEVHHVDRGGEVTYHGPGQLVGYPIIDLRRTFGGPLDYVRALERVIIATLAEFGIPAASDERPTGVWVADAKIAAIGVKVSRGVTTHGFALNIDPDMSYFAHIVPCGMPDVRVTSMAAEMGRPLSVQQVIPELTRQFGAVAGRRMERRAPEAVGFK